MLKRVGAGMRRDKLVGRSFGRVSLDAGHAALFKESFAGTSLTQVTN